MCCSSWRINWGMMKVPSMNPVSQMWRCAHRYHAGIQHFVAVTSFLRLFGEPGKTSQLKFFPFLTPGESPGTDGAVDQEISGNRCPVLQRIRKKRVHKNVGQHQPQDQPTAPMVTLRAPAMPLSPRITSNPRIPPIPRPITGLGERKAAGRKYPLAPVAAISRIRRISNPTLFTSFPV